MRPNEYDVVELANGQLVTVLEVFNDPPGYLCEGASTLYGQDLLSIRDEDIRRITYRHSAYY